MTTIHSPAQERFLINGGKVFSKIDLSEANSRFQ